jgi:hypothetical protein
VKRWKCRTFKHLRPKFDASALAIAFSIPCRTMTVCRMTR